MLMYFYFHSLFFCENPDFTIKLVQIFNIANFYSVILALPELKYRLFLKLVNFF